MMPGMSPATAPERINGDLPLSREERRAYFDHHARRNAVLAARSAGVASRPGPRPSRLAGVAVSDACSPGRVAAIDFFLHVATCVFRHFGAEPITIVDIGAGSGGQLDAFIGLGLRGRYVAIDVARHPAWRDGPRGGFTRELIVADVNAIDPASLPAADVLISNTALEHIRDDEGAIRALSSRLTPRAMQAHFVPGEAALPLYGPHGFRQYSPWCLSRLFPGAEIFRYGGRACAAVHREWITQATRDGTCRRDEDVAGHRRCRDEAIEADERAGNVAALMYGAVAMPVNAA